MVDESKLINVMNFIRKYNEENGFPPAIRDICKECNIKSTATAYSYVEKLQDRGFLTKTDNKKRSVSIGKNGGVNIPLIGTVTAGQPIFAYENYEDYYTFPVGEFKGDDLFMLRVQGTSMIDAGIFNGDKIIVRKQENAENGTIVVAMVDEYDGEATVKRFFRKNGKIVLHPENESLSDMIFEPEQVQIIGVVIGLIRNIKN